MAEVEKLLDEDGQEISPERTKTDPQTVLGLDVGIASVGFAWLDLVNHKIISLGVRLFDAGETPKDGSSLAAPRREKRGQRRRLARRRGRLDNLLRLFKRYELIKTASLPTHTQPNEKTGEPPDSPWRLRAAALERRLGGEELARALFHLSKRRGFKSTRKERALVESDQDKKNKAEKNTEETQKMLAAAKALRAEMEASGAQTVAQFLLNRAASDPLARLRNNPGDYQHTITRDLAENEAKIILARQREMGWPQLDAAFEAEYLKTFEQRPLKSSYGLVGFCQFEKKCKRAARASHSAELFVLWCRLNNLKLRWPGSLDEKCLETDEKKAILELAYKNKSGVTYQQIRKTLEAINPGNKGARFNLLNYNKTKSTGNHEKDEVKFEKESSFGKFAAWHSLKSALEPDWPDDWEKLASSRSILDKLAEIISFYEDDDDCLQRLEAATRSLKLNSAALEKLAALSGPAFKGTIRLSLKALEKILPLLENGERYDEAATKAFDSHSPGGKGFLPLLPPITEIKNQVVVRALAQARKVINAHILRYGLPDQIHLEVARELAKTREERNKYDKRQGEYLAYLGQLKKEAAELFKCGEDDLKLANRLLKYRLWKEQGCCCLYSGNKISMADLTDPVALEIDHALPRSKTFDDSFKNKVLIFTGENKGKGDLTPYEYLTPQGRWDDFSARLWRLPNIPKGKKEHLCIRNLSEDVLKKFKARNLVDTSYIARILKNHIEHHLKPKENARPKWVQTRPGALTAMLRGLWGLAKNRDESPRHHAQDAAVLAASTERMVQLAANWRRDKTSSQKQHAPDPWPGFKNDLLAALAEEDDPLNKIFVSRQPNRKFSGPLHEETIKSLRTGPDGASYVIKRVKLSSLKLSDLDKLVGVNVDKSTGQVSGRDSTLYEALKARLEAFDDKADKAFAKPFYHPGKAGRPQAGAPQIRAVKIITADRPGVTFDKWASSTRGQAKMGVADQGGMPRVDVFGKNNQFFLVPIYNSDLATGLLPNRFCAPNAPRDKWPELDESFVFLFSLYSKDYVVLENRNDKKVSGYFRSMDISTASISLYHGDATSATDKRNPRSQGVKTLKSFHKYAVNIFGELSLVKSEKRPGLPHKRQAGQVDNGLEKCAGGKPRQVKLE